MCCWAILPLGPSLTFTGPSIRICGGKASGRWIALPSPSTILPNLSTSALRHGVALTIVSTPGSKRWLWCISTSRTKSPALRKSMNQWLQPSEKASRRSWQGTHSPMVSSSTQRGWVKVIMAFSRSLGPLTAPIIIVAVVAQAWLVGGQVVDVGQQGRRMTLWEQMTWRMQGMADNVAEADSSGQQGWPTMLWERMTWLERRTADNMIRADSGGQGGGQTMQERSITDNMLREDGGRRRGGQTMLREWMMWQEWHMADDVTRADGDRWQGGRTAMAMLINDVLLIPSFFLFSLSI